jgi:hypothetical protein
VDNRWLENAYNLTVDVVDGCCEKQDTADNPAKISDFFLSVYHEPDPFTIQSSQVLQERYSNELFSEI